MDVEDLVGRLPQAIPDPPTASASRWPRSFRITTAAPTSKFSLPVVSQPRVESIHLAGKIPNGRWP